ncbi:hypothetical protein [Lapidilactobacillus wuchangensis]|nr:hypothetical protein [Lapidilactobacillus wuchangensis]
MASDRILFCQLHQGFWAYRNNILKTKKALREKSLSTFILYSTI